MLDEVEFQQCLRLKGTGSGELRDRQFGPVLEEYERVTGFRETNINVFYHHVLSLYGAPCPACGKPLRTPQAKRCGACGAVVVERAAT